jgi:AraC-like DNA-binding protein
VTDILAEVIAGVRVGRAQSTFVTASGAWGFRYPAMPVSGFHIVLRGHAWLIPPTGEPRALRPGDVVLAPFGSPHGFSHAPGRFDHLPPAVMADGPDPRPADVELLCGAYWLDHGQVPHYLRALPELIAVSPGYEGHPQLRALTDLLAADVADTRPGAGATRPALLDLLLTHVLRHWLDEHHDARLPDVSDPEIGAALGAIHAGPDKPWTVTQLSTVAGLSRAAFTRRFTALIGQSPAAYLTGWRLAQGARLLRETTAPLDSVARQVGYSTGFAFGAAFRREYGISPGRFRAHGRHRLDSTAIVSAR